MRKWLKRIFFGTWRRAIATSVIASFVVAKYYPEQAWPILGPLLQIAIMLVGIRVMLIPFWPLRR